MNFQLPSDFSVMCLLRTLDLSACNLFDGSIPEDLGCLTSLSELNLSRNYFTYLPRSIAQLNCLRHLDITYCEKLIELPELPPCIMKLFTDDRFALQSIRTLPALYKELQLVSFANRKLQELWCASRRKDSGVEMRNCLRENMTDKLEEILLPFLSIVQLKVFSDGLRRRGRFGFVFPGSDPSGEVPMWFKHRETLSEMISINLNSQRYNDKFMGIAIYCQLPFLNDAPPNYSTMKSLANFCWGAAIRCKLVSGCGAMDPPTLEKIVHLEVSNVVAYDSHDCFVFLQLDMTKVYSKGKGKDPLFDPNDYCRFEASLDRRISTNWGIRLVYADDIEETRLKWARQFRKEWPGIQKEELALWKERVDRLSIPKDFQFFVDSLVLCTLPFLPTCPRCLSFAEDFNHVFVNCKYSQLLWRGSRLGLNFEVGTPVQFVGWLFCTWFLEAPEDEDATFFLAILWAIWNHRNKVVHERAVFVPSEVISTAIEEHLRFPNSKSREKEALKEGARETAVGLKAHCVHVDIEQDDKVLVMEVKGAWKEGQEWAGVAWIAYNKQGVKVAAARKSLKVISTLHADVHAFEYAMTSVVGRVSEVIILSDNDTLIKQLQVWDCCSDRDIVYMLHECVEYLKEMKISWKVVKVPRFAVSAAKRSAKMAMTTYIDVLNSALQ